MKKTLIFALLLSQGLNLPAQLPDPGKIMSECRDKSLAGSLTATISLIIREKNGSERHRIISIASKTYPGNLEKRFIKFLSPPDVRGTAMLINDNSETDDEMWIYLPALKRTRRIVSSDKGKSFMSSEFSNADISSPALSDFRYGHETSSGENGEWIINAIPVSEEKADEYGYSRKVSHIGKNNMQIKKMEFYNFDNELFKIIEIRKVHLLKGGNYIVADMKADNIKTGRKSEIIFSDISAGKEVDDNLFTLQNLDR